MQDTPETLQSALDDLTRRVAAFEKAQKQAAEVEPPMLRECRLEALYENSGTHGRAAIDRLRYVEAELSRLREGLKVQEGDITDTLLSDWWRELGTNRLLSPTRAVLREIQRHRALVTK